MENFLNQLQASLAAGIEEENDASSVLPASVFKKQKCFFVVFFHYGVFLLWKSVFSAFFSSKCGFFLNHAGKSQVFLNIGW